MAWSGGCRIPGVENGGRGRENVAGGRRIWLDSGRVGIRNGARAMKWMKAGAGLLGGMLLAGCLAVGPDYREPEVAVPEGWQGAAGESSETIST